ncbi:MAG: hypothetical protein M4579_007452, partial [Chaenotheca gracillima]
NGSHSEIIDGIAEALTVGPVTETVPVLVSPNGSTDTDIYVIKEAESDEEIRVSYKTPFARFREIMGAEDDDKAYWWYSLPGHKDTVLADESEYTLYLENVGKFGSVVLSRGSEDDWKEPEE